MADESDPVRLTKVLVMVPRRAELEQRIHKLAVNTSNIIWTNHFLDRAEQREFTTLDALRILRGGYLSDEIVPGRSAGEWKCKLVMKLKGRREAGVVVIIINSSGLLVKTIEWEDWKGQ